MAQKHSSEDEQLERLAEGVLERMGFELVELEKAGHRARPIVRLRIDRPDSEPGRGVTVDECARVSREIEAVLEAQEDLPASYILEVSSPGVERPLRKRRDFERSIGRRIAVRGFEPLIGGSKRLEGELLAVEGMAGAEHLRLRRANGAEVEVPITGIARANLVVEWDELASGKSRQKK